MASQATKHQVFETRFLGTSEVARQTQAFVFEKPRGFTYRAGQFITLRLGETSALKGDDRDHLFTLSSAPADEVLLITTRMRDSAYKRALGRLEATDPVEVEGPEGKFVLHDDVGKPAVFLAGGIGITPFRSIVRSFRDHPKRAPSITLFYSNPSTADAAYLEELQELEGSIRSFRLIATMTKDKEWPGEDGRIDAAMLRRHGIDLGRAIHYVAGPPAMVHDLQRMLLKAGVAKSRVVVEEFDGY